MKSAVLRSGQMHVRDDVEDPRPGHGQLLVEVAACGICGSDLHFVHHGATMLELGGRMEGTPDLGRVPPDLSRDVFMGHEFAARVLEVGPDTVGPAEGTLVTSVPAMVTSTGMQDLAYTNLFPCGYSERMLLSSLLAIEVPNGLDPRHAALTEPMAVGLHAVNRSGIATGDGALGARLRPGRPRRDRRPATARRRADRGQRLLARPPPARRDDGRRRGRRPGADRAVRAVGGGRWRPLARRVRGRRRAGDDRRGDAAGAVTEPGGRRRRVHAAGHDHAVLRHRQGAQRAVRARLRPAGVRRQPALDRRGRDRRRPDDHRRGRPRRGARRLRVAGQPRASTARSSSCRGPEPCASASIPTTTCCTRWRRRRTSTRAATTTSPTRGSAAGSAWATGPTRATPR